MEANAVVPRFEAGGRGRQGWNAVAALVLDGISSKHTRRAYEQALEEFFIWFQNEPGRQFNTDFTLTALGVDYIEENYTKIPMLTRLLDSGPRTATSSLVSRSSALDREGEAISL